MPTYAFTARSRDGRSLKGIRAAANEAALAAELAAEAAFLVKAEPTGDRQAAGGKGRLRLKRKELAAFLLHLASYVEAGVPLLGALPDYRLPENPAMDPANHDMPRRIEGGPRLSEAMSAYPTIFTPLQVNMVQAGESSGRLDEAIQEVIRLVEWEEQFSAQVKQASTYPIIVLSLIGLIVVVVSMVALPAILKLLRDFHVPLPLVTRIFMGLGDFMVSYGWLLLVVPPLVYGGMKMALRRPDVRLAWDTWILGLWVIGPLVTKLSLSRFSRFFAAQYRAGIPIIQVLRDCEGVTGNARLALCVRQIREGVERGEGLALMAAEVGYFPKLVVRMLAIGEEAGNLEQTLAKVSAYFDAEVQASIKRAFQILEPVLMIVLATILIFVAVAILLPIYTLIGGINANAR